MTATDTAPLPKIRAREVELDGAPTAPAAERSAEFDTGPTKRAAAPGAGSSEPATAAKDAGDPEPAAVDLPPRFGPPPADTESAPARAVKPKRTASKKAAAAPVSPTPPAVRYATFTENLAQATLFLAGLGVGGLGLVSARVPGPAGAHLSNTLCALVTGLAAVAVIAATAGPRRDDRRLGMLIALTGAAAGSAAAAVLWARDSAAVLPVWVPTAAIVAGSVIAAIGFTASAPVRKTRVIVGLAVGIGVCFTAALFSRQLAPMAVELIRGLR